MVNPERYIFDWPGAKTTAKRMEHIRYLLSADEYILSEDAKDVRNWLIEFGSITGDPGDPEGIQFDDEYEANIPIHKVRTRIVVDGKTIDEKVFFFKKDEDGTWKKQG